MGITRGEAAQAAVTQVEKLSQFLKQSDEKAIPTYFPSGVHHTYLIQKVPGKTFHQSISLLRDPSFFPAAWMG